MTTRAYTSIDRTKAVLSNRWLERRWSVADGACYALYFKQARFDWLRAPAPDYSIRVNGQPLGSLVLGELEWSEENSPVGASIVAKRTGGGLQLTSRTQAWHLLPVMLRTHTIMNLSTDVLHIDAFSGERLALHRPSTQVRTHHFQQSHDAVEWTTDERAAAIIYKTAGLFLGQDGGAAFHLFAPQDQFCSIATREPIALASHDSHTLSPSYVIPFSGSWERASQTLLAEFLIEWRRLQAEQDAEA